MSPSSPPSSPAPADLGKRSAQGVLWMLGSAWGVSIVQVGVLVGLSRLLDAQDFGLMSAVLVVVGFGDIFANLGVGSAVIQRPELTARQAAAGFWVTLLLGPLVCGLTYGFAPEIANFMKMPGLEDLLRLCAGLFVVKAAGVVPLGMLQRNLKFRESALTDVLSYIFGYAPMAFIFAVLGYGAAALAIAALFQSILRFVFLMALSPLRLNLLFSFDDVKPLLRYGTGDSIGTILSFAARNVDSVIIGRYLGDEALGLFSRASRLMLTTAALLTKVVERVVFASASRSQNDTALAAAFLGGLRFIALVFVPITVFSILLADDIIVVMLGPGWELAIVPFQVLTVGLLFRTSYKIAAAFVKAKGAVFAFALRTGIYAAFVAAGAFTGAILNSLPLASAGVTAAQFVIFALTLQLTVKVFAIPYWRPVFEHVPGLALGAANALLFWSLLQTEFVVSLTPLPRLALGSAVFAFFNLGAAVIFGRSLLGPEISRRLSKILNRISKRYPFLARLERLLRLESVVEDSPSSDASPNP